MQSKQVFYSVEEAVAKMERYCAYQERCHKEVRQKLRELRMIPDAIDFIIAHLIEQNFLSEERFAKSFARGKFHQKKWGRVRITRELRLRGVSLYLIRAALEEIEPEYMRTFRLLSKAKYRSITETNRYKAQQKFVNFMLYRGWEPHLVYEKARELYDS